MENHAGRGSDGPTLLTLAVHPEKRLIRSRGVTRHVDIRITVADEPRYPAAERMPLNLALVLDRSGSMAGPEIETAKRAAIAVLDRLTPRDRVAVVIFDNEIDLLQPPAPATPEVKARLRRDLARVEARGSTALHEGWLTGCRAAAPENPIDGDAYLSRCLLLTDGQANVGLIDPEAIAVQAAGVWRNAGISTSTFGIGPSYDEGLLGPMAVAGGGQFHHLRTAHEIADTFVGELGELLAVAASRVRLEIEVEPGIAVSPVSDYWLSRDGERHTITIGDLVAGEERHVVVRFGFPPRASTEGHQVRCRLAWQANGETTRTEWLTADFTYASDAECTAEEHDPEVMRWIAEHQADQALKEAMRLGRQGDVHQARDMLAQASQSLQAQAPASPMLHDRVAELRVMEDAMASAAPDPMLIKESAAGAQRRSRGQRDHRKR